MAKTYAQIQAQIHKLQQEAESLKAQEVASVVARIQEAIAHYGLTAADLFGNAPARGRRKPSGLRADKAAKGTKAAATVSPAKYHDGAGRHWSGVGKRPNWFKDALAAGKTAEDMLVKAAT